MLGLMQNQRLLISTLIEHAEANHPRREIISRTSEGPIHRTDYGSIAARARRMANALRALGVEQGDRVGTIAWNGYRHMELYFAVSGMGAVVHTINPRLFPEQLSYIVNHAEDKVLCFDIGMAPLVASLLPQLGQVQHFICMSDAAHMPDVAIPGLLCYETLCAAASEAFDWPQLDENSASALCYTSGTTGHPKGVLYSHRSTVLHAFAACSADGLGVDGDSTALLVVPMFHVNAWGMPYAGAMCGARLVLPGPALDGASVYALLRDEKVSLALGVPTVWLMLFRHVEQQQLRARDELCLDTVVIGGSAAPVSMIEQFEEQFGATVVQAWGMTEMSPMGTVCRLQRHHYRLPRSERLRMQARQGRAVFGVRMKIVDEDGQALPHDGKACGRLLVKGPWILASYFRGEGGQVLDADGYFDTGDVAFIDAEGYMQITDRAKDVIKSGGEWISSIDLENAAMAHPDVAEAAVIGVAHPTWQERPLLVVVARPGTAPTRAALLEFLGARVAKWWCPDDVQFVDSLPHTATGKLHKLKLREQFKDYRLPD